ncbi:MAG: hypothetical protein SVW57_03060 [Thermodesulfobacteriota bacterium]|nr:hypothetical protein [Thermodesulfobacteriota bacterium]
MHNSFHTLMSLFLFGLLCAACATTKLAPELPIKPIEKYLHRQEKDGLVFALEPLSDPRQLREYFGDNLLKKGILPVLVVAQNRNDIETYIVSEESVSMNPGTDQGTGNVRESKGIASSAEARDAVYEKDYEGVRLAIIAPILLPAAFVDWGPTEHSKSVQQSIMSKALRRKSLVPGQSYSGCIYIKLPPDGSYDEAITIVLTAEKLKDGDSLRFTFPVNISAAIGKGVK